jgi:plasmid stabilization system protein ParE
VTYISEDSPQGAIAVLERSLEVADSLATLAERGRIVPVLNEPAIRELFVYRYRLLYRVDEAEVVVIAFLHGSRNFAAWRRDDELR